MSTTINVTVGGNGLLDQSRQQMQANRLGKLERDQDAKAAAEAQQQRQDQRTALIGRMPQTKRVLPEPAANRRPPDDWFRIEARNLDDATTLYTTGADYNYALAFVPDFAFLSDGGPFNDAVFSNEDSIYIHPTLGQIRYGEQLTVDLLGTATRLGKPVLKALNRDFTLEFWFKCVPSPGQSYQNGQQLLLIQYQDTDANPGSPLEISFAFDKDSFFGTQPGLSLIVQTGNSQATARWWRNQSVFDQWVHVALVRQGSNWRYYINGINQASNEVLSYYDTPYGTDFKGAIKMRFDAITYGSISDGSSSVPLLTYGQFAVASTKCYRTADFALPIKRR